MPAEAIVPKLPSPRPDAPIQPSDEADQPSPATSRYRLDWATLLHRVFTIDVLHCKRCGDRRQLISLITEAQIARQILTHMGLPTKAPVNSPA